MVNVEDRQKSFKKGVDQDDGRRRREETTIAIRKQKKEESLSKRRNAGVAQPSTIELDSNSTSLSPDQIPQFVKVLSSDAAGDQVFLATKSIRQLLSRDHNPPVKAVLDSGALPHLVRLLSRTDSTELVLEAAWALTNVASTSYTKQLVAVPNIIFYMVKLLEHGDPSVRDQAAWCLGNIAGDGVELRDLVAAAGAASPLIKNLVNFDNQCLLGNVVWTISNLCRNKPSLEAVRAFIPHLLATLQTATKNETVTDVLWALSYISDGSDDHIEAINKICGRELTEYLVQVLDDETIVALHSPALRILGNFVTGTEDQTQVVIDAGIIDVAPTLLKRKRKNIRKEICWLLSNIAAGTEHQIETLASKPGLLEDIVRVAEQGDFVIRKEAIWALCNIASGGTTEQIDLAVEGGAIPALCDALRLTGEITLMKNVLDALSAILSAGERNESYAELFFECSGVEQIEDVQNSVDDEIYTKAVCILETFFGAEEGDDENLAPAQNGDVFGFGMTAAVSPVPTKNLFGTDYQTSSDGNNGVSMFGSNSMNC